MAEHPHHEPTAMGHVQDQAGYWEIFDKVFGGLDIPLGPTDSHGHPIPLFTVAGHDIFFTKFMLLELIAAALILAIYIPLAKRAKSGELPKGWFWNFFEVLLTFVRNEIAKPTLGDKEADKFVPYLWTVFLFILFLNLLGMFPFMGSPTASIWVTGGMALISFIMMHGAAIAKVGVFKYFKSQWPHIEIVPNPWGTSGGHGHDHGDDHSHDHGHGPITPAAHAEPKAQPSTGQIAAWVFGSAFGIGLCLMIFTIEQFGTVIKSGVLAVRLFANMFGGHMVLATLLLFVYTVGNATASYALWGGVTLTSVLGVVALSLLELFVGFLQAYVFTFLTSLFMGMALNPQH
jgi:F-type H+-transporting ATPase subunit a